MKPRLQALISFARTRFEEAASRGFFFVFTTLREIIVETVDVAPCLAAAGIATIRSRKDSRQ